MARFGRYGMWTTTLLNPALCLFSENAADLLVTERLEVPGPRVAGEELERGAVRQQRPVDGQVYGARYGNMKPDEGISHG